MSEQESSVFIGPFRDNENNCYLRQLWDRKLYRFLRSWFRTVEMDPTIGPDERGLTRIKKTDSGENWGIPPGDGGSSCDYASYFKVIDASDGDGCKIGVKDGSAVDPLVGQCGFVWANGEVVGVDAFESDAIESAGSIWVWLVTQIGPTGASSSVMTTTDSTAPSGYGYATQSQLLGRATIASSGSSVVVAAINQDYLKGGEHMAVFFSDCALLEDEG